MACARGAGTMGRERQGRGEGRGMHAKQTMEWACITQRILWYGCGLDMVGRLERPAVFAGRGSRRLERRGEQLAAQILGSGDTGHRGSSLSLNNGRSVQMEAQQAAALWYGRAQLARLPVWLGFGG